MTRPKPEDLEAAAKMLRTLAAMDGWRRTLDHNNSFGLEVSWTVGASMSGYDELRKRVWSKVFAMFPELIRSAIKDIEREADDALRGLEIKP